MMSMLIFGCSQPLKVGDCVVTKHLIDSKVYTIVALDEPYVKIQAIHSGYTDIRETSDLRRISCYMGDKR